jgi:hypothetical protein
MSSATACISKTTPKPNHADRFLSASRPILPAARSFPAFTLSYREIFPLIAIFAHQSARFSRST